MNGRVCTFLMTHFHKCGSMKDEKQCSEADRKYKIEPPTGPVILKPRSCGTKKQ